MSAQEIIDILSDRGFKVILKDGVPTLQGKRDEFTPALQESLAFHRAKIIEYLSEDQKKQIECPI